MIRQVVAERFEIDRVAGSGGMGTVYRAIDRTDGQPVALKILHGQGTEHIERFVREARILADLRHPGVVRYVAHGRTPAGELYLAMEWLEGEDLSKRLAHAGLTVAEAVRLVSRVAEALAAAHARHVVHRDLKPSNLYLVDGDLDRVKLLDFGVARLQSTSLARTRTGMMLGTPGYMAPEQARGAPDVDERADVFALGCVLFECLAGRPPFVGEHAMAVLAKIILDEAPRARELRADVPPALDALVARMLAKEPDERPADAAAVARELAHLGELDDGEQAPAAPRIEALTIGEQRLVCAVMTGGLEHAREADGPDAMAATLTPDVAYPEREALRTIAEPYGARLEWLASGSIVATLSGQGTATDQAARAARFALALRGALPAGPMALATGRAIVAERWPMGEVIDRAARLLHGHPHGASSIAIDETTAGLLDARFDVSGEPPRLELRGFTAPMDAARTVAGRPTPFVGRDREVATLDANFHGAVEDGVARAIVVTGPPGVGKTRLRQEWLARCRGRDDCEGVAVWIGRGDPMSAGSPFGLIAQVVRDAAGINAGDGPTLRKSKLRALVAGHVAEADRARVGEFLGELAGVPLAAPGSPEESVPLRAARHDAMLMGDQLRRAWEDWLSAECRAHPTILVLEDLHHGDLPTVKLIDSALRTLADRPLFVLALARPEVDDLFPKLWAERGAQEIRLGELSKKAAERLARGVLGDQVAQATVDKVIDRAQGNAFFLEELLRAVTRGEEDALPATVVAMVQARLESLPAEARRVLRAASIFGLVFTRAGVGELLGGAVPPTRRGDTVNTTWMDDWIADLGERELVLSRGDDVYAFRHAPVREAAYAMLTEADRTLGHRLAGAYLERSGGADPMALASHFELGRDLGRAARWIRRGAEQALEGNDFAQAIARAARGIAATSAATSTPGAATSGPPISDEDRGALALVAAEAHRWRGESAEAERRAREAMLWLPRGSAAWCTAAGEAALAAGRLGKIDALVELLRELPPVAPDSPPALPVAWSRAAVQLLFAGRRDLAEPVIRALPDLDERDPTAASRLHMARANLALFDGDLPAYLALNQAANRNYAAAGDLRNVAFTGVSVGFAFIELGAYGNAKLVLRDTLADATRLGLSNVVTLAKHNLGLALARDGAVPAGRAAEEEAIAACVASGDRRLEGLSRHYLAMILQQAGDLAAAAREAQTAVELLAKNPPLRAHAEGTLARVLLAAGRTAEGITAARAAMASLEALGSIQEGEATVRLAHAEALAAAGDAAGARAALDAARGALLARAARIGDPTWRESFLRNVPEHAVTMGQS